MSQPANSGHFSVSGLPNFHGYVALDPETFIPKRGLLTRYGKKLMEASKEEVKPAKIPKYRSIDDTWEKG